MKRENKTTGEQTFSIFAPDATSVQLVGTFTEWAQNPINLRKAADGVWKTAVRLDPGTYYYKFLLDGQWHDDPECTLRISNSYGTEDMIREVARA